MTLWKVTCLEDKFPGMWQRWYRHQSIGIGWPPQDGFRLIGETPGRPGWKAARNKMRSIVPGDVIAVALKGNRVGRIGYVTANRTEDDEWAPLVQKSRDYPHGEMGRRILVRWDMTVGPDNRDMVVQLPPRARLTNAELRPAISKINSLSLEALIVAMSDPVNWVGLLTHFKYERALSEFIAAYPHRLEDGLLPHPNEKIRERVCKDRTRLDVLLEDRKGQPVIVECKQGSPTTANIRQLREYMTHLRTDTGLPVRGILVHGGSKKLSKEVAAEAAKRPSVEVVQYALDVAFSLSA